MELGHIAGVQAAAKSLLLEYLVALRTNVHAVMTLDVAAARDLTERFGSESLDWQADGMLVDFPEGRIHGFLRTPNIGAKHQKKWQQRVAKALKRAGLGRAPSG